MRDFWKMFLNATALVVLFASTAAAQVTVSFTPIPAETLPGVPVDFRITLSSASSAPAAMYNSAVLEVTSEGGETFLAAQDGRIARPPLDSPQESFLIIQPGTTRDFYITRDPLLFGPFGDARLSNPGRYSMRIGVVPAGAGEGGELWSNPVTLTVQQPQGDDAAVWTMVQEHATKAGLDPFESADWGRIHVVQEVYAKYPKSRYVPYLAYYKLMDTRAADLPAADQVRDVEAALALTPAGPLADRLRLMLAEIHQQSGDRNASILDVDGAIAEINIARQLVQDVQANSVYPFVRAEASAFRIMSDEGIRKDVADSFESRRKAPFPQVIPFVDCVQVHNDGRLTARFGYRNIKDQTEEIAPGEKNALDPADAAKKLPDSFRPGVHGNALRATTNGGPVTWRLSQYTATATKDSPRCGGGNN